MIFIIFFQCFLIIRYYSGAWLYANFYDFLRKDHRLPEKNRLDIGAIVAVIGSAVAVVLVVLIAVLITVLVTKRRWVVAVVDFVSVLIFVFCHNILINYWCNFRACRESKTVGVKGAEQQASNHYLHLPSHGKRNTF
jgi:drug/metabolite transporter (DMT)-like permease